MLAALSQAPRERQFTPWKAVRLGTCKAPDKYRAALKKAKITTAAWADNLLKAPEFACTSELTEMNLLILCVRDLGFKHGACYEDICARAVEIGLRICPAEVGPALRLIYKGQPRGERLRIAMEAITDLDGCCGIFAVDRCFDELTLRGRPGRPDHLWLVDDRFVFLCPG
jgi:hypothetical protein